MINNLGYWRPFLRIFFQAFQNEVLTLSADRITLRKIDIFLNYLSKFVLTLYIEWYSSIKKLEDQNSKIPNIYLIIILFFHYYLRRRVQGSSASSASQQRRIYRPSKITNFDNSLNKSRRTSWISIFSGFISLWMMSLSWMKSTACAICLVIVLTFS